MKIPLPRDEATGLTIQAPKNNILFSNFKGKEIFFLFKFGNSKFCPAVKSIICLLGFVNVKFRPR